jgi:hypothetical protein
MCVGNWNLKMYVYLYSFIETYTCIDVYQPVKSNNNNNNINYKIYVCVLCVWDEKENSRSLTLGERNHHKAWAHLDTAFDAVCWQRADHGAAPARAIGQVRALELSAPLPFSIAKSFPGGLKWWLDVAARALDCCSRLACPTFITRTSLK